MKPSKSLLSEPVRTVLHLSPAVAVAAFVCAQRSGMTFSEWLNSAVTRACCTDQLEPESNTGILLTAQPVLELVAEVASAAPHLLTRKWSVLLAHMRIDEALWDFPKLTAEDIEDGTAMGLCEPSVNVDALRREWPKLVAAAFVC